MTELAAVGIKVHGIDSVDGATTSLDSLAKAETKAKSASSELANQSKKTSSDIDRLAGAAKAAALGIAAVFSVSSLKDYADTWSDLQSRVGAATGDMAGAADQMQRLVDIANASYSSLEQTVSAYAGNVGTLKDLGKSASEAADFTESLNHMLVLTATRGERAASVQNALSKAMAVGKLQADGLETVLANGGEVAAALAKELNTTVSGLRAMASEGKITGAVIADAIIKPLEEVRERAAEMPATVGDAMTRVTTNFTEFVGVLDKTTGASAAAANSIIEFADGLRNITNNKEALDTIIIAGETLAVVIGSRLVTAGLASAGSFAAMQLAAMRAAGGVNALALAGRAASGALALVGGPLGLLVTAVGAGALAWSHYGKSARDNADAGVLGLVDTKKSVEDLISEFQKLNSLQQERTLAIKQEDLKKATQEASKAVFDLGNAFKPAMDKGTKAAAQFRADFTADIKAVTSDTTLSADEMANAMAALVQAYIDNGKASEGSKGKLLEMAQAAVQSADQVRTLRQEIEGLNAASQIMGPPTSAMNRPTGTPNPTPTPTKEDPGAALIKQMRERIALIGKETEYEQLLAKIRVGSIKFQTEAQKQSALAYAQTIDLLEAQAKAAEDAQKGFESNADAIANLEQQLMLAALSGKDLVQAQALLSLNEYATDEQIANVQELAEALFVLEDKKKRAEKFGSGTDIDAAILGNASPLSGGGFDDQFARYEAEAAAEDERYAAQLQRLTEARELELITQERYNSLFEQMQKSHADRLSQIDQARWTLTLGTAAQGFDSLAQVMKNAHGEQAGIFKAMFAVSKAFSIAEAMLGLNNAISNAMALPWPANLAAAASAAGYMASIISNVQSVTMGFANGGYTGSGGKYDPAGIVHKGEVVFSQEDIARHGGVEAVETFRKTGYLERNASMAAPAASSAATPANVTVQVIEDASKAGRTEESTGDNSERVIQIFVANIRQGGEAAEALQSTFGLARQGV